MNLRTLGLAILLVGAFSISAKATEVLPVLLTINDTDPSAVTITATGAYAAVNDSITNENAGIDLLQFFTSASYSDPPSLGGLFPAGGSQAYNEWGTDNYSGSDVDFNPWRSGEGGSDLQIFTTSSPAFTGSWTVDLSSDSSALPSLGANGEILAGYSLDHGQVIGAWEVSSVVPEPSQYGLFIALVMAGLVAARGFSCAAVTV
jgi:hypothetical protein